MNYDALLGQVKTLTDGLFYSTESDATFEIWDTANWPEHPEFPALFGWDTKINPKKQTLARFFKPMLISFDWFTETEKHILKRYEVLFSTLKSGLKTPTVWRHGKIEIQVVILGKTDDNRWFCMTTRATET